MPKAWEQNTSTWEEVTVDRSLPAISGPISDRPVDLTLTFDKRFAAPPKFVWVVRSAHPKDRTLPNSADECETMSLAHEQFLSYCHIFPVLHPGRPVVPYLRWDLRPGPEHIRRLFQMLRLPKSYLEVFWKHRHHFAKRLHPVFAEINNGGPFGRWIHDLCERPARGLGLFVQAFGVM
jgi:hypothetical protein